MSSSKGKSAGRKNAALYANNLLSVQTGLEDKELDEVTRKELMAQTQKISSAYTGNANRGGNSAKNISPLITGLQGVGAELEKAKSGVDPKYKSRLAVQKLFEATLEKPDARRLRGDIMQTGTLLRI